MKKWWKHSKNSIMRGVLTAACAMLFFVSQKSVCFAEATGTIKAPTAYIRQSPDKNSEAVGSTYSGKTVTIISQTTDASGYVWYEIHVDADKTGYIRSDLVNVDSSSGTIPTSSSTASASSSEQPAAAAAGAEIQPETGMDAQYATIKVRSANIRSAAGKTKGWICTLPENTQVVVSGQTEGSDGTWYYITFTGTDGGDKDGYVRSDMVTLGDMVPVEEPVEEPQEPQPEAETPEEAPTVNQDYELKYEFDDKAGEDTWFIYDRTDPANVNKQRVKEVLTAAHARGANEEMDAKTISTQRIVIIVLIAVIIILAVVMTILIFKLRDAYYEEYEDDEDEEEEEDRRKRERRREAEEAKRGEGRTNSGKSDGRSEKSERRREREEREEREEPIRRKSSPAREERQSAPRKKSTATDRRMPEREVSYEEEAAEHVKPAPKKKAKNFMIDDDDFEFEFLNMKNKDKDI